MPAYAPPRTAADIERNVLALYGELPRDPGVLASTAVHDDGERLRVLRIGPSAPKSRWDFFALQVARARADAIVTTGRILRDEPTLRYDLDLPDDGRGALHAFRRDVLGLTEPAELFVLTRGDVDPAHPGLGGWARPTLVVPEGTPPAPHGAPVWAMEALDARALVAALQKRGFRTVLVEAGPESARGLYDSPALVDELLLSRFVGTRIAPEAEGGTFLALGEVHALFGPAWSARRFEESSGPWWLERYRA